MSSKRTSGNIVDSERPDIQETGTKKGWSSNFLLFIYILLAIASGTANRVAFRLMQYSTINYSYFISQLTTFVYLPVNFIAILLKLLFTKDITPEMTRFPKWKFLVMGFFDSFSGILMVVGGIYVPGMMQNLLLQGAVPVTMIASLLLLRSRGDDLCRTARYTLEERGIEFTERYVGDDAIKIAAQKNQSPCRITVGGVEVQNLQDVFRYSSAPDPDIIARCLSWCCDKKAPSGFDLSIDDDPLGPAAVRNKQVVLYTDAHSWTRHLTSFYTAAQYIGAMVIMAGLVLSVWPAISGQGGAGPFFWDLIFASTTIPIALSGVYKEIAFKTVEHDVWYLNGYVAIFQFLIGLAFAPLAAYMTALPIPQIPENLWQGAQCWMAGTNFISVENGFLCSTSVDCGVDNNPICCDSCDGSIPGVSSLSALTGTTIYMVFNVMYNVFLVLVIKHGSAALMYATSAVVLPLGATAFTIPLFLGAHAQSFTIYTGLGLGVVILGLLIYRFVDVILSWRKDERTAESLPLQQ